MRWFEKDIEVRYADTDQMGVVHHATYALYCEIGRTDLCAQLGLPYHELEQVGFYLMVADLYGRFKAPARYGEPIIVRSAIKVLKKRLIEFAYEIVNKDSGQLLYTGTTKHIITHKTDRAVTLPDAYFDVLAKGIDKNEA